MHVATIIICEACTCHNVCGSQFALYPHFLMPRPGYQYVCIYSAVAAMYMYTLSVLYIQQ